MTRIFTLIAVLAAVTLSACSGGGGGGASKSITSQAVSYSIDGATKTTITSYSDGSSDSASLTGTLTTPSYSTDGSQKTLVYSFNDGTTHNGATLNGTLTNKTYSADSSQEFKTYSFSDNSSYTATLQSTGFQTQWGSDHKTKTITYSFADGNSRAYVTTVQPNTVVPVATPAAYPSDWSTGNSIGSVTPPTTAPKQDVYGDGVVKQVWEDGTAAKPFQQATLTPNGATGTGAINDPNAFVTAPTKGNYDLHWGTPDPAGPAYAANFNQGNSSYTLPTSTKIFDAVLTSNTSGCLSAGDKVSGCGAILSTPSSEVIDAWNKGWTGKGQNVLIYDDIGASPISPHPATVETIAYRYAWGSSFYGMTYRTTTPNIHDLDGTVSTTNNTVPINVMNMSFGANLAGAIGRQNTSANPWTTQELLAQRTNYQTNYTNIAIFISNSSYMGPNNIGTGGFNFSDAVLVKAAGNDQIDAQYEPLVYWMSRNQNDVLRLLVVGALTNVGTTAAPVTIATYSNVAGTDSVIQSRFLTESGKSPFGSNADAYNGAVLQSSSSDGNSGNVGTSYAAPRVAGYAAIVRQKFSNLTSANTADILLATARYDTLSCYTTSSGCDKAIYGQGEASLARALAPVGYLR
jgi:hypothetical protein